MQVIFEVVVLCVDGDCHTQIRVMQCCFMCSCLLHPVQSGSEFKTSSSWYLKIVCEHRHTGPFSSGVVEGG